MGNSKSVKKGVAVVTAVIVAVVMVCVSVVCNLFSTKTESSNQTYLDDAKAQLTEYSDNYNYTKFVFIYSILYKPCIFKAYRLLNVQTLCIFPCFCPYEPKQGKFLFSADYLIQQSCGSTLCFPCSVSVNVHCGTDISVSEKFLHILRCCPV